MSNEIINPLIKTYFSTAEWLKIMKKVAFNIASEASYVYILNGQMFIKIGQFWRIFENMKLTIK